MIEKAFDERKLARLEKLIARVEAKLQKFDVASVGASSASPVSAVIEQQIEPDTSSEFFRSGIPNPHSNS